MPLTITPRQQNGITILALSGRLTLGEGTGLLRAAVQKQLADGPGMVLDLSALHYIDSAGLGELVGSYASASSRGKQLKLLRPHERLHSLLQITKLYTTFEVFQDEAAAVASFLTPPRN